MESNALSVDRLIFIRNPPRTVYNLFCQCPYTNFNRFSASPFEKVYFLQNSPALRKAPLVTGVVVTLEPIDVVLVAGVLTFVAVTFVGKTSP